jgi:hypothetical protein
MAFFPYYMTGLLPASPPLVGGVKGSYKELSVFVSGKRKLQFKTYASVHGPKKDSWMDKNYTLFPVTMKVG